MAVFVRALNDAVAGDGTTLDPASPSPHQVSAGLCGAGAEVPMLPLIAVELLAMRPISQRQQFENNAQRLWANQTKTHTPSPLVGCENS